jgi:hypothetical protein
MRVYVASAGLYLTLDAGKFYAVDVNSKTGAVRVGLLAATEFTPTARLRIEQPAHIQGVGAYRPTQQIPLERGAYIVPLHRSGATHATPASNAGPDPSITWVELTADTH